jgi:hypothetical protein
MEVYIMMQTIVAAMATGVLADDNGRQYVTSTAYNTMNNLLVVPLKNLGTRLGLSTKTPSDRAECSNKNFDPEDELTDDDISKFANQFDDPEQRTDAHDKLKNVQDKYRKAERAIRDAAVHSNDDGIMTQAMVKQMAAVNALVEQMCKRDNDAQPVTIEDAGNISRGPIKYIKLKANISLSTLTGIVGENTEYLEVMDSNGRIIWKPNNSRERDAAMEQLDHTEYNDASERILTRHTDALRKANTSPDVIVLFESEYRFFMREIIQTWRLFGRSCALLLDDRVREIVASETANPDTPGRQSFAWGNRFINLAINLKQQSRVNVNDTTEPRVPHVPYRGPNRDPNPTKREPAFFVNANGVFGYNKSAKDKMKTDKVCCFYNIKKCRENASHGNWKHVCGICGENHPACEKHIT